MQLAQFSKYFIAVALFGVASFGFIANAQQTGGGQPPEQGVTPNSLSGYAWSSTIGWVSVLGDGYAVSVEDNGKMSGYAWSSNIGWISFNTSDTTGCPSGSCQARFNAQTGDVTGWARAIAGGSAQSGNWDGWIYLGQSSNVGVSATGCAWSGYAWGGGENTFNGVIGWLSFAGPGYGVTGTGNACNVDGEPDLTAGAATITKAADDAVATIEASISNIGSQPVVGGIDAKVQIRLHSTQDPRTGNDDISFDIDDAVTDLEVSESGTASYDWNNPVSGTHEARICADFDNTISESNEENNCGGWTEFQIDNPNNGGGLDFSCSANTGSVAVGEEVTWSIEDLDGNVGVTTYSWSGTDNLSGTNDSVTKAYTTTGTKTASLAVTAENASKTVSCTSSVSGGSCSGCVTVTSPPSVDLNAAPDRFVVGGTTRITWDSTNYSGSCTATGFNSSGLAFGDSTVPANGSVVVTPAAGEHTYSIVCGSASDTENITVLEPGITITANGEEELVRIGKDADPIALVWTAEDVDSCTIAESTGDLPGFPVNNAADADGNVSDSRAPAVTDRTVFTITCQAVGETYVNSVTVNVPPDFEEF